MLKNEKGDLKIEKKKYKKKEKTLENGEIKPKRKYNRRSKDEKDKKAPKVKRIKKEPKPKIERVKKEKKLKKEKKPKKEKKQKREKKEKKPKREKKPKKEKRVESMVCEVCKEPTTELKCKSCRNKYHIACFDPNLLPKF